MLQRAIEREFLAQIEGDIVGLMAEGGLEAEKGGDRVREAVRKGCDKGKEGGGVNSEGGARELAYSGIP